ncbi:hypothetical protein QUA71_18505 [Microcoleus sp. MON1_C5]|uniref:hypothetical protein n=1 Tax=Microcoleus sp. MON1_C5 TaxID=2818828 RepID=UPI002FD2F4CF
MDARKARVGCLRKILLNSLSYGVRWVADRLFDSISSVVGDRAVPQVARYPGVTGGIDVSAATKLSQQQEQCEQSAQSESG